MQPISQAEPDTEVSPNELRVLVLTPTGRDAGLISDLLRHAQITAEICSSFDCLERETRRGVGAVVLAEEALTESNLERLAMLSNQQPPWSDFPLILLTLGGKVTRNTLRSRQRWESLRNVLLLERPIRPETIVSTMQGALRTRHQQYDVRNHIRRQAQTEEVLRRTEKLAVAGRLAATIAHEINNPLEAVVNILWLLQNDPTVPEHARVRLKEADEELLRVAHVAKQTLGYYRASSTVQKLHVSEIIEGVLAVVAPRLRNKDICVHKEIGQGFEITGSDSELRQVIANLLVNSIDALQPHGRIRIRVTSTMGDRHVVRISVADNGPGIPKSHRTRVFEPFFSTKGDTGTGLGLWVAKEIVEKHHGSIRLRSRTGPDQSGTVFTVFLPGCIDDTKDKAPEPSLGERGAA